MEHVSDQKPVKRTPEHLQYISNKLRNWQVTCHGISEQQELMQEIGEFFAPEIDEAMHYTGKLPSFRDCGGRAERMELLKQEAELVIYERMLLSEEQFTDFEACLQEYRQAIRKRLLSYSQTAQKESFYVDAKLDVATGENESRRIISAKKDITREATNPNFASEEEQETEEDFMDRKMGTYRPF